MPVADSSTPWLEGQDLDLQLELIEHVQIMHTAISIPHDCPAGTSHG